MQTLAIQAICAIKSDYTMPMIQQALKSSDWLVLDTALWALGCKAPNKKIAQELTLAVPTKYLLQHEFQKLLEG